MRPPSAPLTPGLPQAGDRGEFIGRDRHGNTFLLRWHSRDGWLALGWEGAGDAGWPIRHALTGEQQGLIVGHIEIAGSGQSESPAGPEGAAVKNGTRPDDRHPAGVRALGTHIELERARIRRGLSELGYPLTADLVALLDPDLELSASEVDQ